MKHRWLNGRIGDNHINIRDIAHLYKCDMLKFAAVNQCDFLLRSFDKFCQQFGTSKESFRASFIERDSTKAYKCHIDI